ncbi:MAG: hypothetical protein IJR28_07385 [Ottowia sp.]|nr:hypothetical protein [Ottowia sp.]
MTENSTPTPALDADSGAPAKCKCADMLKNLAGKPLHIRIIAWYLAACVLLWVLGWVFRGDPGYTVTAVLARPVSLLLMAAAVVFIVMAGFLSIVERLRWKVVFAYIGACLAAWIWALIFGNPAPGTFALKAVAGPLAALLLAAAAFTVLGHVLRALGIDTSASSAAPQEQAQS